MKLYTIYPQINYTFIYINTLIQTYDNCFRTILKIDNTYTKVLILEQAVVLATIYLLFVHRQTQIILSKKFSKWAYYSSHLRN